MKVKKILSIQAAPQSCPEATVRLPSSCSVQAEVSVPTLSLSSYLPALQAHIYLLFRLLELSFFLFDSLDKHLSHLLFFFLEFP